MELGTKHFSDESCVLVIYMFWWQRQFRGQSQNGQKGWKLPFLALFAPWGPEVELGTKHFSDESCVLVINMFWWQRQFRGRSQNGQKGGNDHF